MYGTGIHCTVYFKYTFLLYNIHRHVHWKQYTYSLNKDHYHVHCVLLEMSHDLQIPVCQWLWPHNLSGWLEKGLFSLLHRQVSLLKPSPGECVCLSCHASNPVWCLSQRFEGLQSLPIVRALGWGKGREGWLYLQYWYIHLKHKTMYPFFEN